MGSSNLLVSFLLRSDIKDYTMVLVKVTVLDVVLWLLTWSSNVYIEPVSRRFANLIYVLWTVSLVPQFSIREINTI